MLGAPHQLHFFCNFYKSLFTLVLRDVVKGYFNHCLELLFAIYSVLRIQFFYILFFYIKPYCVQNEIKFLRL